MTCDGVNTLEGMTVEVCARRLLEYCKSHNWAGVDPYDALNSRLLEKTPLLRSRVFRIGVTQVLKRLPVNLRYLLRISDEQNPKALGLFLMAMLKLKKLRLVDSDDLILYLLERLRVLRSNGTPYWCWGYSFPWQTRTDLVPRWSPNLVCTSFVANALLDAYEHTNQPECLSMAISSGEYLLSELYWIGHDGVASFSYPLPGLKSRVHNANFLAAALLCRLYKHSDEGKFLDAAMRTARYSAGQQRNDGSWAYGEQSTQQWVDNFHTGYNLCALRTIGKVGHTDEFEMCLAKGYEFYRRHFFMEDGAPKYFHNSVYPIDIHSVAQSLITLVSLRGLDRSAGRFANTIWKWSVKHMWDRNGYFYYRVLRSGTVKISYMRWSQAWMLLAMTTMLEYGNNPSMKSGHAG